MGNMESAGPTPGLCGAETQMLSREVAVEGIISSFLVTISVFGDTVAAAWARAAMQSHSATVCLCCRQPFVATGAEHAGRSQAHKGLLSVPCLGDEPLPATQYVTCTLSLQVQVDLTKAW